MASASITGHCSHARLGSEMRLVRTLGVFLLGFYAVVAAAAAGAR
jgi:hypothetical protein